MTEINSDNGGTIRIADEVLVTIAGTAALEAEGVSGLGISGYFSNDIASKFTRRNISRGVLVNVDGNKVTLSLTVCVKFGKKLQAVSREVQERVKSAIETMTGLEVVEVNVSVGNLSSDKQRRA